MSEESIKKIDNNETNLKAIEYMGENNPCTFLFFIIYYS